MEYGAGGATCGAAMSSSTEAMLSSSFMVESSKQDHVGLCKLATNAASLPPSVSASAPAARDDEVKTQTSAPPLHACRHTCACQRGASSLVSGMIQFEASLYKQLVRTFVFTSALSAVQSRAPSVVRNPWLYSDCRWFRFLRCERVQLGCGSPVPKTQDSSVSKGRESSR